jgi:uncharacterized Zn finger protein
MTIPQPPEERTSDRKAVLFCPACAHESPLPGDWLVEERGGEVVYVCPECGETVVSQSPPRLAHC